MKQGLLWYDGDPRHDLAQIVAAAARRHEEKYGTTPNLCYVHSSAMDAKEQTLGDVRLVTSRSSLRHHFWIGVEPKQ